MAQDNSTKLVVGLVILLAITGVIFLMRGGEYRFPGRESPAQYGWSGECCTCTRALLGVRGDILTQTREVLFRNERVPDCAAACAAYHEQTRNPRAKYSVESFISNDPECRTSLPMPRAYAGAGGFNDQPSQDRYYITS